jgi:hypothetical protein
MKINITRTQYRTLLEILEIADWVLHAHVSERAETKKHREFEQMVFSFAKDFGFEDLVEYDEEMKVRFPTREFEETSRGMDYVREFENDTFWNELVQRLTERDLIRQYGEERVETMNRRELGEKENQLERRYAEEFYQNGLENVTLRN